MSKLNTTQLTRDMLDAVQTVLKAHWKDTKPFAEAEVKKLAITATQIAAGQLAGTLNKAQAKILVRMQGNASQAVLTSIETIGMIAAQDAINAAVAVLRGAVNSAIGVPFL
jgi:hypothetical protein